MKHTAYLLALALACLLVLCCGCVLAEPAANISDTTGPVISNIWVTVPGKTEQKEFISCTIHDESGVMSATFTVALKPADTSITQIFTISNQPIIGGKNHKYDNIFSQNNISTWFGYVPGTYSIVSITAIDKCRNVTTVMLDKPVSWEWSDPTLEKPYQYPTLTGFQFDGIESGDSVLATDTLTLDMKATSYAGSPNYVNNITMTVYNEHMIPIEKLTVYDHYKTKTSSGTKIMKQVIRTDAAATEPQRDGTIPQIKFPMNTLPKGTYYFSLEVTDYIGGRTVLTDRQLLSVNLITENPIHDAPAISNVQFDQCGLQLDGTDTVVVSADIVPAEGTTLDFGTVKATFVSEDGQKTYKKLMYPVSGDRYETEWTPDIATEVNGVYYLTEISATESYIPQVEGDPEPVTLSAALDCTGLDYWFWFVDSAVRPDTITLSADTLDLSTDISGTTSAKLAAAILPVTCTDSRIVWHSSNESVATVNQSGLVKALGAGAAEITCRSEYNPEIAASCHVVVDGADDLAREVIINGKGKLELVFTADNPAPTRELTATVKPVTASRLVRWTSSNPGIAAVDAETGVVTARGDGTTTIYAVSADKAKVPSAPLIVNVSTLKAESLTLPEESITLVITGADPAPARAIAAELLPANAYNNTLCWTSSRPEVASVKDGVITAHKTGHAKITVSTEDGSLSDFVIVHVTDEIVVTDVVISEKEIALLLSDDTPAPTCRLSARALPTDACQDIGWSSSDEKVATVNEYGLVTAIGDGTAVITARSLDPNVDSLVFDECEVTVLRGYAEAIELDKYSAELVFSADSKHPTATVRATVLPACASQRVYWFSSDPSVAQIDEKGVITAVSDGEAFIYAGSSDGTMVSSKEMTVSVKTVAVSKIKLSTEQLTLTMSLAEPSPSARLTASVEPAKAYNPALLWASGNEKVATVENGTVTGRGFGSAIISAYAADGSGVVAQCIVKVVSDTAVTDIILSREELNLDLQDRDSFTLSCKVLPATAAVKTVTWSSSDNTVAAVSAKGVVTAIGEGSCDITACSDDTGSLVFASCHVTVTEEGIVIARRITLSESAVSLNRTYARPFPAKKLSASVTPADARNKGVEWFSSDESVAIVSENGKITAVGEGSCVITCQSADPDSEAYAICTVEVSDNAPAAIRFTKKSLTLAKNATRSLKSSVRVTPATASYKLKWSSSNKSVATVNNRGVVSARKAGSCTITVKVVGTKLSAKLNLKVK